MTRYEECSDPDRLAAHRAEHGEEAVQWRKDRLPAGEWRPTICANPRDFMGAMSAGTVYRLVHPEPDYPIVWVKGAKCRLLAEHGGWCWVDARPLTPTTVRSPDVLREPPKPPTKRVRLDRLPGERLPGCEWDVGAFGHRGGGAYRAYREFGTNNWQDFTVDPDGTVEVLA